MVEIECRRGVHFSFHLRLEDDGLGSTTNAPEEGDNR